MRAACSCFSLSRVWFLREREACPVGLWSARMTFIRSLRVVSFTSSCPLFRQSTENASVTEYRAPSRLLRAWGPLLNLHLESRDRWHLGKVGCSKTVGPSITAQQESEHILCLTPNLVVSLIYVLVKKNEEMKMADSLLQFVIKPPIPQIQIMKSYPTSHIICYNLW